jgi:hypothetical protein
VSEDVGRSREISNMVSGRAALRGRARRRIITRCRASGCPHANTLRRQSCVALLETVHAWRAHGCCCLPSCSSMNQIARKVKLLCRDLCSAMKNVCGAHATHSVRSVYVHKSMLAQQSSAVALIEATNRPEPSPVEQVSRRRHFATQGRSTARAC